MKTKKLSIENYTALAVALLAQTTSDAQVEIKDFDPDLRMMNWREDTLFHDTIGIDIDENGIDDILFLYEADSGEWLVNAEVYAICQDAILGFGQTDDFVFMYGLQTGDTIDENLYWDNTNIWIHTIEVSLVGSYISTTSWNFIRQESFLPIKLDLDGGIHYGWLRLSSSTIEDEDYEYHNKTGSPLAILDMTYNAVAGQQIICNPEQMLQHNTISFPQLIDNIDANDITDLSFSFYAEDSIDYAELRFFLVPSRDAVINFTKEEALLLEENRVLKISSASVVLGTTNLFQLPSTMLDIEGNTFSSENYYSGFFMKIPAGMDTSAIGLSSPLNTIKPELQQCHLEIEDIDLYFNEEGFFEVSFLTELYDPDVDSFGVALAEDWVLTWTAWDNYYEDFDWDAIDFSSVVNIPKTMDTFYVKSLEGITTDVYGNPIDSGEVFNPIILGYADGYYRDLMCLSTEKIYLHYPPDTETVTLPQNIYSTSNINILQSQSGSFDIFIEEFNAAVYTLEMQNINGQILHAQDISSPHQTFSFPSLPNGIYIATVKENDIPVAVAKVILQY